MVCGQDVVHSTTVNGDVDFNLLLCAVDVAFSVVNADKDAVVVNVFLLERLWDSRD